MFAEAHQSGHYPLVYKGRLGLAILGVVVFAGAVLFAALPYTVSVADANRIAGNSQDDMETRCDAALIQMLGSPSQGRAQVGTGDDGSPTITFSNHRPTCLTVARYRIGMAAGLLVIAVAVGVLMLVARRRETADRGQSSAAMAEPSSAP
jgi:hypothetical protein